MEIYNLKSTKEKKRLLRRNQTEAEKKVWDGLRNRRFQNLKFFRQYGIGHYIADFYCPEMRLVIEVDGDQHFLDEVIAYDGEREKFFSALNIKILRFTNMDILTNIENVMDRIQMSPSLFKEGERGSL